MGEMVKVGQENVTPAYLAWPESGDTRSAIILIHEVWGLNDHTRDVADRLSREGYLVLAPDLLSHTGITEQMSPALIARTQDPATRDEAQKELRAAMAPIQSSEFAKDTVTQLEACFEYLQSERGATKIGVIGFCFGGTYSWSLACAEPDLAVAIVFYGQAPGDEQLAAINCPVYGFYGADDKVLADDLPRVEAAMQRFGKSFTYEIYPNTGHAFFNDTNSRTYREGPAKDAWAKVLAIIKRELS